MRTSSNKKTQQLRVRRQDWIIVQACHNFTEALHLHTCFFIHFFSDLNLAVWIYVLREFLSRVDAPPQA